MRTGRNSPSRPRRAPSVQLYRGAAVVCIDPGVGGTGLAFWSSWPHADAPAWAPDATEVVRPTYPRAPWLDRAFSCGERVGIFISRCNATHIIVEDQAVWTSAVGAASAGRGDVIRLAQLAGLILAHARIYGSLRTYLLPPREWKGQLPKAAVAARIRRALGRAYPDHAADAVGMGLYLQGKL